MVSQRPTVEPPTLEPVLDALDDADARAILKQLDEPMTARQLSDACDIPLSTTYRKLDLLTDAALLAEGTEIRTDGHHTTTYAVAFTRVSISLTDDRDLQVMVERPERTPDQRIADLWSRVREET